MPRAHYLEQLQGELIVLKGELDDALELMRNATAERSRMRALHEIDAMAKLKVLNRARGYLGMKLVVVEDLPVVPEPEI